MRRYRWFVANWPYSIRTIAGKLKFLAFSDANPTGFVIERVRDDYIEARYVERVEYSETVTDPFGNETIFPRMDFIQTFFKISNEIFGLELIDYPRSNQSLFSRLSEVSSFKVFFNAPKVDVMKWAREFCRLADIPTMMDSVQIGTISMGNGIFAKAIVKGDLDVSDAAKDLTEGRRHTIDKIQIKLIGKFRGKIVLSANGSARVDVDQYELIIDLLRSTLALAVIPQD